MKQTKPKNNLPKYWAVKNDGSQLFKDTVIKYINDNYTKSKYEISWQAAHVNCFYGYDGNNRMNGANVSLIGFDDFVSPVTQLSIPEFIELSKPIEDSVIEHGNLPPKWYIENDKSEEFNNIVLPYLNNITNPIDEIIIAWNGISKYYGYMGADWGDNGGIASMDNAEWFIGKYCTKIDSVSDFKKLLAGSMAYTLEDKTFDVFENQFRPYEYAKNGINEKGELGEIKTMPYTDALNKLKEPTKWEPKCGEIVWAWDNKSHKVKHKFITKVVGIKCAHPFICTHEFYGEDIGIAFNLVGFSNISQVIEPKEYTIQEVAKALGEEVGNFTIKQ